MYQAPDMVWIRNLYQMMSDDAISLVTWIVYILHVKSLYCMARLKNELFACAQKLQLGLFYREVIPKENWSTSKGFM